jgi:hypothetical protein
MYGMFGLSRCLGAVCPYRKWASLPQTEGISTLV